MRNAASIVFRNYQSSPLKMVLDSASFSLKKTIAKTITRLNEQSCIQP